MLEKYLFKLLNLNRFICLMYGQGIIRCLPRSGHRRTKGTKRFPLCVPLQTGCSDIRYNWRQSCRTWISWLWTSLSSLDHRVFNGFTVVYYIAGISRAVFNIQFHVSLCRQGVLTCPTPLCAVTQARSWTLSFVLTMTTSLPVAQRTAVSW